jgi:hypothetical protein
MTSPSPAAKCQHGSRYGNLPLLFPPLRSAAIAFEAVLESEHQVAPHGVATRAKIGGLTPTSVNEMQGRAPILVPGDIPSQRRAVPLRMVPAASHPNGAYHSDMICFASQQIGSPVSETGQYRRFGHSGPMSALPPISAKVAVRQKGRKVPKGDIATLTRSPRRLSPVVQATW